MAGRILTNSIGTVFGPPSGPLVDLGIQNTHSIQMPYIIKPSIYRKKGAYFGNGLNQWPAVDVEDGQFTQFSYLALL